MNHVLPDWMFFSHIGAILLCRIRAVLQETTTNEQLKVMSKFFKVLQGIN